MKNTKIFYSPERVILRIYDYDLSPSDEFLERQKLLKDYKEQNHDFCIRSKKEHRSDDHRQKINQIQQMLKLLGYAHNNEWNYFFTGTVDPQQYDSANFREVSSLISCCFKRIRRSDPRFRYCFILEKHENGNYHAHGFVWLPDQFVNPFPYYRRPNGQKIVPSKSKFVQYAIKQDFYPLGLNTISPINDMASVSDYCAKYIGKAIEQGEYNAKAIFKSHGLKCWDIDYGNLSKDYINGHFDNFRIESDLFHTDYILDRDYIQFNQFKQIDIKM